MLKVRWVINRRFKRKLYIHIGMPKTGSSAIQAFLALNPEFLLVNNFSFPRHPGFKQAFQTSAGNVPQMRDWIKNNNYKGFEIFVNSSWCRNVILSSEILFNVFKEKPNELANFIKEYDYKIICYVRRMDELVESCINQQIKNHNLDNYSNYERVSENHDYYSALINGLDYFDKKRIIIKLYEKEQFKGGNIYKDFLSLFNIKPNSCVVYPNKNVNPSLNFEALEFRKLLNILEIDKKDIPFKYRVNAILAQYSVDEKHDKRAFVLNNKQRLKLLNSYKEKELLLLKKYNLKKLFNSNFIGHSSSDEVKLTAPRADYILKYIKSTQIQLYKELVTKISNSEIETTETKVLVSAVNQTRSL